MTKRAMMVFIALAVCGWSTHAVAAKSIEIGSVNLQRVVAESLEGKQVSKKIEQIKAARLKKIKKLKRDVAALRTRAKKAQAKGVNARKLSALVVRARKKNIALKRYIEDVNEDLNNRNNALNISVLGKAKDAIFKIAKAKGLVVIYKDSDNIAYLDPAADITDAVIKAVNKGGK